MERTKPSTNISGLLLFVVPKPRTYIVAPSAQELPAFCNTYSPGTEPNNELEVLTLVLWDNCPAVTIPPAVVDSFQSTEIPRPYCCMLSVSCASIFADTSKPVITNFIALFIVFFYFFIH